MNNLKKLGTTMRFGKGTAKQTMFQRVIVSPEQQSNLQKELDEVVLICHAAQGHRGFVEDKIDWYRQAKILDKFISGSTPVYRSLRYPGEDPEVYSNAQNWLESKLASFISGLPTLQQPADDSRAHPSRQCP